MSENPKHTPGPWTIEPRKCGSGYWVQAGDVSICEIWHDDKAEADAHLIAAAPEMFDALCKVMGAFADTEKPTASGLSMFRAAYKAADAAIKKARGEHE